RRAVDEQEGVVAERPRQLAQELPAALVVLAVARALELLAGPEDRALGADVEPVGVEHRPLVVVAQEGDPAALHHPVDTLTGVGPVTDDIAQAIDLGDLLRLDVVEDDLQGFEVPVDVTDQSTTHGKGPPRTPAAGILTLENSAMVPHNLSRIDRF